ncbi:MAG: UDP-2,4-diacetamido-2,4,6-trideoxy-beta-L-altropyranose hydrolase [Coprobacillus cateniformis]|uniref:UDP-2,4-diacetamido-2,4, 6-trideoxy-beta-L-altropyranose hydrolase n=1 Tax=Longibaculum muris TaxID=1796628 RepID=UPI003AB876BE|nr:UDP-2,4-diacetamido-2,4,6-trideoxy-beta-L-altropyranose hydrolase [Coprobacillus cateniformis]
MIVFEVDCNSHIGMGHLMRCLAIADNLKKDVLFVTRSIEAREILEEKNYKVYLSNGVYNNVFLDENIYQLISKKKKIDLCIVDSYYVNNNFFNSLRKYAKILYIDDLNLKKWDVDYLLNNNLSAFYRDYDKLYKKSKTKLFLGPKYLLLRDEFLKCSPICIKQKVNNVFISSGGSDSCKSVLRILNILIEIIELKQIHFHVLVGRLNQSLYELLELEKKYPFIKIYYNISYVDKIMKKCDLAISAAGNTLYELSYLGIPTLTYIIAANQELGARVFEKQHLIASLGYMDESFEFRLKEACVSLLNDYEKRKYYHNQMYNTMNICKEKRLITTINTIITGEKL